MKEELEIWKDIPGYEGLYQVSNLGRVYSLPKEWVSSVVRKHNGKILKTRVNKNGYEELSLTKKGKCKTFRVHKLVAIVFLNHKPDGHNLVVDHINDNKLDNRVENLQIVTQRFNAYKTQNKYSSKNKGVSLCKSSNKWKSYIYINGKIKSLGSFSSEEEASKYYQDALKSIEEGAEIKVKRRKCSSEHKGVCFDKSRCKWQSNIVINGKKKYLGRFNCELAASYAYQKALKEYEQKIN